MAALGMDDELLASDWAWMCTQCQRCIYVCPMKIDTPRLVYNLSEHYGGGYGVVHLWTIICLAMGILGENERAYLRDDLKEAAVYGA